MANSLQIRRILASCMILLITNLSVSAQSTDLTCNFQPSSNYVENGMFDVYTFEVEEGILLDPGKIIGQITLLVDNFTNAFGYDEPYFIKPYNKKSSPKPSHFDVKFISVTTKQNDTTPTPESADTTSASTTTMSATKTTTVNDRYRRNAGTLFSSAQQLPTTVNARANKQNSFSTTNAYNWNNSSYSVFGKTSHLGLTGNPITLSPTTVYPKHTTSFGTSSSTNVTSSLSPMTSSASPLTVNATTPMTNMTSSTSLTTPTTSNMTSLPATSSTPEQPSDCVVAQIVQIYDLDREKQDVHYLTINEANNEMGLPTIVMLKVTDINDNSPIFVKESLSSKISKDVQYGQVVAEIKATDADIGLNADLRYDIQIFTERRGNEKASPDFPTFLIHETSGLVILIGSIEDLKPPTQITFNVVVKDRGGERVGNRATASATVSIIDNSWKPEPVNPKVSGGVIAGCVMGGVVFIGICIFIVVHCARKRFIRRSNGQLEFMLDDETLISA